MYVKPNLKPLKAQFSKIKYELVAKNDPSQQNKTTEKECKKLFNFMKSATREILGLKENEPNQLLPPNLEITLKIKTLRFIKENLPNYTKRLHNNKI